MELSTRELAVPELSLVVLVGVTGSGKSTFARAHFKPTEVISSDFCRGLVADDENDQSATPAAFELLRYIAGQRLAGGRLTVVDATNVQPEGRRDLVMLAREHDVLPVAIVLDLPEKLCAERNARRPDRDFGAHVIRRQRDQLRRSRNGLPREGFRTVHVLRSPEEVAAATIARTKLFSDLRHQSGPFDVIGDVHGCLTELEQLLVSLGYVLERDDAGRPAGARHPSRRAVFLGDLVDRGPDTPGVLRLVMGMVAAGTALCVPGNHEAKLSKALRGRNVQRSHGLAQTMEQLAGEPAELRAEVERFIDGLISHYVLDGGRLVVAHAGLIERYHGRASGRVREFCLYGQTTGETDDYGLPVRYPWAQEYRGRAMVLYGHTPVPEPEWLNNTMCLDTGCVFGGRLTALNYPERTVVSVPAARVYYAQARPFTAVSTSGATAGPVPAVSPSGVPGSPRSSGPGRREPDVLDIGDVSGSRVIETGYLPRVGVREAHAAAALEVMSRFAIDPRWLLYLPPTMSPVATAERPDLLEHPDQAFDAYRADGVESVLCEEKHMGSRAVLLVCRSPAAAQARFGVPAGDAPDAPAVSAPAPDAPAAGAPAPDAPAAGAPAAGAPAAGAPASDAPASAGPAADAGTVSAVSSGAIWTRTGRPFFSPELTASLIDQVRAAAEKTGLFSELGTSWLLLDAELLPWNVKAGQLLRDQYAAVGAAAQASLPAAVSALTQAFARGLPSDGPQVDALLARTRARAANAEAFTAAYLRYCWATDGLSGVRVAPFQVLASEGAVYHQRPHLWHLTVADRLAAASPELIATTSRLAVEVTEPASVAAATRWWEELTAAGGEGMVVKPAANLARARRDSGPGQHSRDSGPGQHSRDSGPGQHSHGLLQPGLKVRGREYLRIIYGPDYTEPANLARLRQRGLGHKRSLALREYALGLEALDRVARGEPLWRVHECVFAVLALESEPVDPRL
jgi:protein phosphatase